MARIHTGVPWPPGNDSDIRLELAIDIAGLGVFDLDLATDHIHWSPRASEIYGADSAALGAWSAWFARVHLEDQPKLLALRQALNTDPTLNDGDDFFRFLRPDGEERWVAKRYRIFRNGAGRAVKVCGVIADETERRRAEARNRQLNFELQHRIKNIVAVIRSLSKRTLESSTTLEDYDAHFDGRLDALSRIQATMARHVADGVDLEGIVREEFLRHAAGDED